MAEWFTAKRYGFGTGIPCAWQGWALSLAFIALAVAAAVLFEDRPLILMAVLVPATLLFILIAAKTTKGGWKWRWGKTEDTW